jgi:hypothetical protein
MSSDAKAIRELIKTRGYWEVDIRPIEPKKDRFESIADCMTKVIDSVVRLRGWPYPFYIGKAPPYPMQERIEACGDFRDIKEYWAMFLSGHFYHIFSCREDWLKERIDIFGPSNYSDTPPRTVLEFMMTLYSVTEIYEFAIRLAQKNVFGKKVQIKIKLHGMEGRKLTTFEPFRGPFFSDYVCRQKDLAFNKQVSVEELIGEGHKMALDTVSSIFETFGWFNMPKEHLKEDQKKFLEGRI